MYELFYNFTAEPFRLSPDHRFCFEHNSYGKARAYLAYAFKRAEGFVMITGRPGTGKTTLIGELVESLSTDKVVTANLVCTQLQADDLLKTVAYSFGISPAQVGKAELLQHLSTLLHSWHREGRRALLVVDEAQDLSSSAMEELRLLTNIQSNGQPLLQIFLLGQPELRDLILSRGMEQVHQRIVAASHIEGLEEDETEAYVMHRLSRVGWRGDPAIDRAVFPLIHRFSEGVPRRINLICSRLFLLGSVEERHAIGVRDVSVVIGELQAENLAAGTGISQEDFHNSADPQWVPVPGAAQQSCPPTHVQTTTIASTTTVQADLADQTAEAKKKVIPSSEPLVETTLNGDSVISSAPIDNLEPVSEEPRDFVPEGELGAVPESDPDTVFDDDPGYIPEDDRVSVAEDDPVVEPRSTGEPVSRPMSFSSDESDDSSVSESNFAGSSGGEAVAPAPRRRFMLIMLLTVVAVVLVLLLKAWFVTEDGGSLLEQELLSSTSDSPAVAPFAEEGDHLDAVIEKPDIVPSVPVASDTSDRRQKLMPMVVEAGLRLLIPVATAGDVLPAKSAQDVAPSDRHEMALLAAPDEESPTTLSAETAAKPSWEEIILIPFSFDSDDLVPDSRLALERAAMLLRDDGTREAAIAGFTDSQGDSKYNLILSRKRADAVERFLVDAGIARERLHVEGRGVLSNPDESLASLLEDPMEPYRIVQITLVGEG
jgi:general secretion pathway protein A